MPSQKYVNLGQSTLASGYTAGNTTITVQTGDGALFPSAGNFTIAMNNPPAFFLLCTSRTGDVLTVSASGTEGTTATNQSSGTQITQVITAAALDGIRSDISGIGTFASLPATGMKAGDRYQTTDGPYSFIFDGTSWNAFFGSIPVTVPSGSFTGRNFGTSSATVVGGAIDLIWQGSASDISRAYTQPVPGSTYTLLIAGQVGTVGAIGIALFDGTKYESYFTGQDDKLHGFDWTNATTFSARVFADIPVIWFPNGLIWMKLVEDGTHRTFSIGTNPFHMQQVSQIATGTFLTPTDIGVGVDPSDSSNALSPETLLLSFKLTP